MKTESELIKDYQLKYMAAVEAEKQMEKYFRDKIKELLIKAKTIEDFEAIKWIVAPMPECASKVLIFRTIILIEDRVIKSSKPLE